MSRVTTTASLLALCQVMVLVPAACVIDNPQSCDLHPNDPDCLARCESDNHCQAPTGVCDLGGAEICVQCTPSEPEACTGATPACIANQCQKCTAHAQCTASNVCLPDGTCADEAMVAYVAQDGRGTACTKGSPCGTLADGINANTPYVKMEVGSVSDDNGTIIDGRVVTILADQGAKLSRALPGVILQVQDDGADVRIFDLEITNGAGIGNPAISITGGGSPQLALTGVAVDDNQGVGILETAGTLMLSHATISSNLGGGLSVSGGTLTISQSTISANSGNGISSTGGTLTISQSTIGGNTEDGILATGGILTVLRSTISSNPGGGVMASGVAFDITNCFIERNGSFNNSFIGGASLSPANGSASRFELGAALSRHVSTGGVSIT